MDRFKIIMWYLYNIYSTKSLPVLRNLVKYIVTVAKFSSLYTLNLVSAMYKPILFNIFVVFVKYCPKTTLTKGRIKVYPT